MPSNLKAKSETLTRFEGFETISAGYCEESTDWSETLTRFEGFETFFIVLPSKAKKWFK